MGEHEPGGVPPPSTTGLYPNGLLPGKSVFAIRSLDAERLGKAEERTAVLIACIQPNPRSVHRRNAIARYVASLIRVCFPCQVQIVTFGSLPRETYLPDGDIDLAVNANQTMKDSWLHLVLDMLEKEKKNEDARFHVKDVQYIQAEVKLIKCLVENIVVDISFNQIGGLRTQSFLEEVDRHINQTHLFKRSIILIKAWCYYESRILGAHHGLISTYALETLVLYTFHVFNNSFSGPLEVLYRFLDFFSKFDWQNFCISLRGPVPISSLPDVTPEPPRRDVGELRDSEYLKNSSRAFAVYRTSQETQGQPFVSSPFNVVDPLCENNNLGVDVSEGTFFRIRNALSFGAKNLARLLECPEENVIREVNHFLMNTWERHGSGLPPVPRNTLRSRLGDPEPYHQVENVTISSSSKKNQNAARLGGVHGARSMPSQQENCGTEVKSRATCQTQKSSGKSYKPARDVSSNQSASNDKLQQTIKPEVKVNSFHGRHLFGRTRSSPELTETYGEALLQSRHSRAPEAGKRQTSSTRVDNIRKEILESETLSNNARYSADSSSVRGTDSYEMHQANDKPVSAEHSFVPSNRKRGENSHSAPRTESDPSRQFVPKKESVPDCTVTSCQWQKHPKYGLVPSQTERLHDSTVHEPAQVSGSESTMSLGHGMQQNGVDNDARTFVPTGPPVPFVVMFPMPLASVQGHLPCDGSGRTLSYDPRFEPVATRPPNSYPRYATDTARNESGTWTYFPNPKISPREQRPSSGVRHGSYGQERNEHYSDRKGNWNAGTKTRGSGGSHNNRNQADNNKPRYLNRRSCVEEGYRGIEPKLAERDDSIVRKIEYMSEFLFSFKFMNICLVILLRCYCLPLPIFVIDFSFYSLGDLSSKSSFSEIYLKKLAIYLQKVHLVRDYSGSLIKVYKYISSEIW